MKNRLKIKVCGMRNPENISEVAALSPDYMGFIFYEKSPRYVENEQNIDAIKAIKKEIKKVGVFVNESFESIYENVQKYDLQAVQLYGKDILNDCQKLKDKNIEVIKTFSVDEHFDFNETIAYQSVCDYFLFDTKSEGYGGIGKSFNWDFLQKYNQHLPYILAGGLSFESFNKLESLNNTALFALDFNSKFETEPGLKDIEKLKKIWEYLK